MSQWKVKVEIEAASLADAQLLVAAMERGVTDSDKAGMIELSDTLKYRMGELSELNTARIEQVRAAAEQRHCIGSDDEIEIDDDAIVSEGEDGPFIQGWLFVPKDQLPAEPGEESARFTNHYRHCGTEWTDTWSCMCNDRCPVCNAEIEPYQSDDAQGQEGTGD